MKIADGFLLRKIMGRWMVVPTGSQSVATGGMFSINESSALLWNALKDGSDEASLAELLCGTYDVDRETAVADVARFLKRLEELGALSR